MEVCHLLTNRKTENYGSRSTRVGFWDFGEEKRELPKNISNVGLAISQKVELGKVLRYKRKIAREEEKGTILDPSRREIPINALDSRGKISTSRKSWKEEGPEFRSCRGPKYLSAREGRDRGTVIGGAAWGKKKANLLYSESLSPRSENTTS